MGQLSDRQIRARYAILTRLLYDGTRKRRTKWELLKMTDDMWRVILTPPIEKVAR